MTSLYSRKHPDTDIVPAPVAANARSLPVRLFLITVAIAPSLTVWAEAVLIRASKLLEGMNLTRAEATSLLRDFADRLEKE